MYVVHTYISYTGLSLEICRRSGKIDVHVRVLVRVVQCACVRMLFCGGCLYACHIFMYLYVCMLVFTTIFFTSLFLCVQIVCIYVESDAQKCVCVCVFVC
jgi:hypothetical protein